MSKSDIKSHHRSRGRPCGLGPRMTNLKHGAYAKNLTEVYKFWRKHSSHLAASVDQRLDSYAQALGWQKDHLQCNNLRDLVVLTISRELLLTKIIDQDFTRLVCDPETKKTVRKRPADQFKRLEELENEIQERLISFGLIKTESGNTNEDNSSFILSLSRKLKNEDTTG